MRPPTHNQKVPRGLYKRPDLGCNHPDWNKCPCDWYAIYRGMKKNLTLWWRDNAPEGHTKSINSGEAATRVFGRFKDWIDNGASPQGTKVEHMTFGQLLDKFEDEKLKVKLKLATRGPRSGEEIKVLTGEGEHSNATLAMVEIYRAKWGKHKLADLAKNPLVFKQWLDAEQKKRNWGHGDPLRAERTWNRYYELGRRIFEFARGWRLVVENPFTSYKAVFNANSEPGNRERRIPSEVDEKIKKLCKDKFLDLEHFPSLSSEMYRRYLAGTQMGLRVTEMLKVQVKHVNYKQMANEVIGGKVHKVLVITLPAKNTKAGKKMKKDQKCYAGTTELIKVLEARRFLGPEGFVFGAEDGSYVESFDGPAKRLFEEAGLTWGRFGDDSFVWHDTRHEFISRLVDQGATDVELLKLARLEDLETAQKYTASRDERIASLSTRVGG